MRSSLLLMFSLLVAVQWTESSPDPDPLDTININLNIRGEARMEEKEEFKGLGEMERDYSALTQHPEVEQENPEEDQDYGSKPHPPPKCGIENEPEGESGCPQVSRISGGCEAFPHQYPWMVRFGGCGGSLITARHVLTAKHCLDDKIGKYAKVNVHNQKDPLDYEEVLIKDTVDPGVKESDLGILILDRPVDLTKRNIGTVCLPSSSDKDYRGKQVTAMGWGATYAFSKGSDVLKHVHLTVDQREDKYELYTKVGWIEARAQDPCVGDSGGPLIYKDPEDGISTVIGTVWGGGFNCRDGQNFTDHEHYIPGLYTWSKVTVLLDWIHSVIDE